MSLNFSGWYYNRHYVSTRLHFVCMTFRNNNESRIKSLPISSLLSRYYRDICLYSRGITTNTLLVTACSPQVSLHYGCRGIPAVVCVTNTHWFLADRSNGRAIATLLRLSSVCLSSVMLCIVAKRCVLEQKLLWRAYRKSYVTNRLVPKWMTLTIVYRSYQGHVNHCVTFDVEYLGNS